MRGRIVAGLLLGTLASWAVAIGRLRASRVFAVAFFLLGLLVALYPSAVPGLTEPGSMS